MKRLAVAFVLLVSASAPLLAAEVPFAGPSVISNVAAGASAVFVADLDTDGDADVLSASADDNKIAWYENTNGSGAFSAPQVITSAALQASSVFAGDLDGDGDLDVLAASAGDNTVAWFENLDGGGTFSAAQVITAAALTASSVFAADVDRDGDLDVLSASAGDDTIAWYPNTDGAGTFGPRQVIASNALLASSVFAADLDGDGDVDVLSTSRGDDTIAWYSNTDGAGAFGPRQVVDATADAASWVSAADLDGDGDLDVLGTSSGDDTVAWFRNTDGAGVFGPPQTLSSAADGASSITAADLDSDGDLDAFVTSTNDDTVSWFENTTGAASFGPRRIIPAAASGPVAGAVADVDGDGDLDVVAAASAADAVVWCKNETIHRNAAFAESHTIFFNPVSATAVIPADLDGDGDLDAVSSALNGAEVAWYENLDGAGTFGPQHVITTAANGTFSIFVADLDRDGDLDVLSASNFDDKIAWYENLDGAANFGPQLVISTAGDGPFSVFSADLDGDGDMDVLSASQNDDEIAWYKNLDGAGSFGVQQVISTASDSPISVVAADVDGDGDLDVLSASSNDDSIAWHSNLTGAGTFGPRQVISTAADTATSVAAADLDGDGDMDALSTSFTDNEVAWYENLDGGGSFGAQRIISTATSGPRSVSVADVDGDGDLDVLSASQNDDKIAWYENVNGAGTFGTQRNISQLPDQPFCVAAADVDGDGDLDALSASNGDGWISWFRNRGAQFSLATTDTSPGGVFAGGTDDVLRIVVKHNGRAGDSSLELATLRLLFEESPGDVLTSAEANAMIVRLRVFRDEGSGVFEGGPETLVTTVTPLTLSAGLLTVVLPDGSPLVEVTPGASATFFVVLSLTADAATQNPNSILLTHLAGASTAEDRVRDLALSAEPALNVSVAIGDIPVPVVAGTVPDGSGVPGPGLRIGRAGGSLQLSWHPSCRFDDSDYAVYEGALGSFASHVPKLCSTSGEIAATIAPAAGSSYYLVVPLSATREGSYGKRSDGTERPASATPCAAQLIGSCVACQNVGQCNDGEFCNGEEACVNQVCQAGLPYDCTTVTFRQGVGGYTGTQDTHLQEAVPADVNGDQPQWGWDDDDPSGSPIQKIFGLLRFGQIFGSGPGLIPVRANIQSATVSYTVFDTGAAAQVREMLVDWDETASLTSLCGVTCDPGSEFSSVVSGMAPASSDGIHGVNVTSSVQAWAHAPATNRGWAFVPAGAGGVEVSSSEYDEDERPQLVATYLPPPPCVGPADCNDGNVCTTDLCTSGACVNSSIASCCNLPEDCEDGNPCTTDTCNSHTCQHTNNTAACNDLNSCTANDVCSGGVCQPGAAVVCNDGLACTTDSCLPGSGCSTVDTCSGTNVCNTANGLCQAPAALPVVPGSAWYYLDDGSNQGTAWRALAFDDSGWRYGRAELGYGESSQTTVVNCGPDAPACAQDNFVTTYFRRYFSVANPGSVTSMTLRVKRDDGVVVYLNGTEVWRNNMPGLAINYLTPAQITVEGDTFLLAPAPNPSLLVTGINVIAVEIHQVAPDSSDISFDLELTSP